MRLKRSNTWQGGINEYLVVREGMSECGEEERRERHGGMDNQAVTQN